MPSHACAVPSVDCGLLVLQHAFTDVYGSGQLGDIHVLRTYALVFPVALYCGWCVCVTHATWGGVVTQRTTTLGRPCVYEHGACGISLFCIYSSVFLLGAASLAALLSIEVRNRSALLAYLRAALEPRARCCCACEGPRPPSACATPDDSLRCSCVHCRLLVMSFGSCCARKELGSTQLSSLTLQRAVASSEASGAATPAYDIRSSISLRHSLRGGCL